MFPVILGPKPQSNRSGLSGGAIAGIVVACLSAFTAIMGFLCKVCCSESDEEGGENMALNAKWGNFKNVVLRGEHINFVSS